MTKQRSEVKVQLYFPIGLSIIISTYSERLYISSTYQLTQFLLFSVIISIFSFAFETMAKLF